MITVYAKLMVSDMFIPVLNQGGKLGDAQTLLTDNVLSTGGQDHDLSALLRHHLDNKAGITIRSKLTGEKLERKYYK